MSLTLKVKGLDKLIADFDNLAKDTQVKTNVALDVFGQRVVKDAVDLVALNSSDEGKLKNSIKSTVGSLNVTITVNTNYAAYIEFGTRKFAASYVSSLPSDWQTFAAEFKGKGQGDFYDFLFAILDWVKRKGLANRYDIRSRNVITRAGRRIPLAKKDDDNLERISWLIAMKILRNGIRAKPYLYPSIQKNIPVLEKDLENIFN